MDSLGNKLKKIRTENKLLQSDVAEMAGISRSTYILIENGTSKNISIETAKGISKALNIPFTELFEIETPVPDIENLKFENLKLNSINEQSQKVINALENQVAVLQQIVVWYFVQNYMNDLSLFVRAEENKPVTNPKEAMSKLERFNNRLKRYQEDFKEDIKNEFYTVAQYESLINQIKRTAKNEVINLNEDIEKYKFWIPDEFKNENLQPEITDELKDISKLNIDVKLKPSSPDQNDDQ